jgi:hypothetical protein
MAMLCRADLEGVQKTAGKNATLHFEELYPHKKVSPIQRYRALAPTPIALL